MRTWKDLGISDTGYLTEIDNNYVCDKVQLFNDEYFNGELEIPSYKIHTFTATGRCAGCVITRKDSNYYTNVGLLVSFNIGNKKLSKRAKASEKFWCETILHEMIHVYQHQVLKLNWRSMVDDGYAHGYTFVKKMDEINEGGKWNITTKYDVDSFDITDEHSDSIKSDFYFWTVELKDSSSYGEGSSVVGLTKISDAATLKAKCSRIKFYKVVNPSNMWNLKLTKSKISGPVWSKEKLDDFIASGDVIEEEVEKEDTAKKISDTCKFAGYISSDTPHVVHCNVYKKNKEVDVIDTFKKDYGDFADMFKRGYVLSIYEILNGEAFTSSNILRGSSFKRAYRFSKDEIDKLLNDKYIKLDKTVEIHSEYFDERKAMFESVFEKSNDIDIPDDTDGGAEFFKGADEEVSELGNRIGIDYDKITKYELWAATHYEYYTHKDSLKKSGLPADNILYVRFGSDFADANDDDLKTFYFNVVCHE